MSKGSGYVPIDKSLTQELNNLGRSFTRLEAMFSYTVDQDNGKGGSINGYAQLWNWSRNKTRKFLKEIRTVKGHSKDSRRTPDGHPVHFIDKALWVSKDSERTLEGQSKDSERYTTIDPNPFPNPNPILKSKEKDLNPFVETSDEVRLSEFLFSLMLQNNPKAKKPNIQTWAKHIDYMIRIDKRSIEEIEQVIRWSQQDSFWLVNILSTGKLREKFDKLWLKANIIRPQTEAEKKAQLFQAYLQDEAQQNEEPCSGPHEVIDIEDSAKTANPIIGALPGKRSDS